VPKTAVLENVESHFFMSDSKIKIILSLMPSGASVGLLRTDFYPADSKSAYSYAQGGH
jgi:hypothetical protein